MSATATIDARSLIAEMAALTETIASLERLLEVMGDGSYDPARLDAPDITGDEAARDLDWHRGRLGELRDELAAVEARAGEVA